MFDLVTITESFKLFACKLCTIIRNYPVRYAKTHKYAAQKFNYIFFSSFPDRLCLNLFCKYIDCYDQEFITSSGPWERTKYINPQVANGHDKGLYSKLALAGVLVTQKIDMTRRS